MIPDDILKLTDALAESLIISDLNDLQEVGKIYDLYLKIGDEAKKSAILDISKICDESIELVKLVMIDESLNKDDVLDKLYALTSKIQYVSRTGYQSQVNTSEDLKQESLAESIPTTNNSNKSKRNFELPEIVDEEIFNEFLSEQNSVLQNIETLLLSLEKVKDKDTLNNLRRVFHTLKGEAAVFGLNNVVRFCHLAEDLTESQDIDLPIDKLLSVKDWFKLVFDALKANEQMPEPDESLVMMLQNEMNKSVTKKYFNEEIIAEQTPDITENDSLNNGTEIILTGDVDLISDFVVEAQEHIDNIDSKLLTLETDPEDSDILNAVFRVFHTLKGAAGFLALDDIAKLAHTTENLLDLARKHDLILTGSKIDVVFEAIDQMNKLVANIRDGLSEGLTSYPYDPNLDILIEKIKKVAAGDDLESKSHFAVDIKNETNLEVEELSDNNNIKNNSEITPETLSLVQNTLDKNKQAKVRIKESIKIDSENLDRLIDAIGELVIIESMISQDPALKKTGSSKLLKSISQMNKITRELQQVSMSLRMIPVRATFQKMARVVRDLSKKSNKLVVFNTNGEDTMLDKSVVDRIGDPLIHLIRNSVDHGIELSPDDRVRAGKDKTGQIELSSFHKGGNIHIEIKDDGRGLDRDAILKKAIDKGLVKEGQSLSEREIYNLILIPGFSTAKKVTDVSGRGVGMDVVKRNIDDLRGSVEISSEFGNGSLFSLKLPLTLAIIDGMLVKIGNEKYIIPTLSIVKSVRPAPDDISTVINRGEMIKIRDDLIPLFRLSNLFNIKNATTDLTEGIVIVVEDSGKLTGLLVDELLGQQSTVIKNLGASMKGLTGISGGSILSDGQVGLILDIAGIIKIATSSGKNDIVNKNEEVHVEV